MWFSDCTLSAKKIRNRHDEISALNETFEELLMITFLLKKLCLDMYEINFHNAEVWQKVSLEGITFLELNSRSMTKDLTYIRVSFSSADYLSDSFRSIICLHRVYFNWRIQLCLHFLDKSNLRPTDYESVP